MDIILLERIKGLGQMGSVVRVANGYARNFLLPQNKALRCNKVNMAIFESQLKHLEIKNQERKTAATELATKFEGQKFITIRSAGSTGQLYGSVSARNIVDLINEAGFQINRSHVQLDIPIKTLGSHKIKLDLYPDVEVDIVIHVARSEEEAAHHTQKKDVSIIQDASGEAEVASGTEDDPNENMSSISLEADAEESGI